MKAREAQLSAHETSLQKLGDEHRAALDLQRAAMQREIDRLSAKNEESDGNVKRLMAENDELEEKVSALESGGAVLESECNHKGIRSHFSNLCQHSEELLAALASHHALIEKLNQSAIELRAKVFMFYRGAKRVNMDTTWLGVPMQLPFESAFDFAKGRVWNNVTATKGQLIEDGLGKASAQICMKSEEATRFL